MSQEKPARSAAITGGGWPPGLAFPTRTGIFGRKRFSFPLLGVDEIGA